jgi:peptidoglycan/LPS O-acetylase OafA/YrhL
MRANQFQSLTSLRGLAALAVILFHCSSAAFGGASGPGLTLIPRRGYLAVDFFFLLSGFILAHVYADDFAQRVELAKFGRFLWARFARIYPVHLFALLLHVKLYGAGPAFSGGALLANLFLLQAPWLGYDSWNVVSWSISAEWHAYLLFPVLCLVLLRLRPTLAAILAAGCFAVLALFAANPTNSVAHVEHGMTVLARCLPEFFLGMLSYRLYRSGWAHRWWRADGTFAVLNLGIVYLAAAWPTDLAIIALLPAVLLAAASNEGRMQTLLETRPLVFLGDISYSIYMVHVFCLTAVIGAVTGGASLVGLGLLERLGILTIAIVLSLVMATLVSRCIEYPARAALRRVFEPRQAPFGRPKPLLSPF